MNLNQSPLPHSSSYQLARAGAFTILPRATTSECVRGVTTVFGSRPYLVFMTLTSPWHSIRQRDRNVYHDNDLCPTGQAIDPKYRKRGHRCRMRCAACARLGSPEATEARLAQLLPL
jgi:hypothetical protein